MTRKIPSPKAFKFAGQYCSFCGDTSCALCPRPGWPEGTMICAACLAENYEGADKVAAGD